MEVTPQNKYGMESQPLILQSGTGWLNYSAPQALWLLYAVGAFVKITFVIWLVPVQQFRYISMSNHFLIPGLRCSGFILHTKS